MNGNISSDGLLLMEDNELMRTSPNSQLLNLVHYLNGNQLFCRATARLKSLITGLNRSQSHSVFIVINGVSMQQQQQEHTSLVGQNSTNTYTQTHILTRKTAQNAVKFTDNKRLMILFSIKSTIIYIMI